MLHADSVPVGNGRVIASAPTTSAGGPSPGGPVSTPSITVALTPSSTQIVEGGAQTFSCAVTGSTNTACVWSVQEGAGGGSVTVSGVYTAPETPGAYHLIGASEADPTRAATASIVVVAPATNPVSGAPTHVACVGDSITAGYFASSVAAAYPADLQNLMGSGTQVMNFGHNGATMLSDGDTPYIDQTEYTAATAFVANAGKKAIVDIIIMLGTNDSKPANWYPNGTSAQDSSIQYATDYATMISHFANQPTHPTIYLALPATAYSDGYGIVQETIVGEIIPIIKQLAMQQNLTVIDVNGPTAGVPGDFTGDGIHPNDTGYALIAQVMYDGLLGIPYVAK